MENLKTSAENTDNRWASIQEEQYKGLAPEDPNKLDVGLYTHDEFISLQGNNGERYRGMAETNPNELGPGTMSHEEFIAYQGKNGEIYRGMVPEDPDKYRKETTGTNSPEIAKAVTEASKFDFNPKGIDQIVDQIINEPSAVQKMLELRMHRTADFMEGNGDYNKETVASDVNFILNLAGKGFDFSNFKVDLNTKLGGEPDVVDFPGMIDRYQQGIAKLTEKGKDTVIQATPTPNIPASDIPASGALDFISERFQLEQSKK